MYERKKAKERSKSENIENTHESVATLSCSNSLSFFLNVLFFTSCYWSRKKEREE
jgi:hypothetical protein